jgi:hypothetical protein
MRRLTQMRGHRRRNLVAGEARTPRRGRGSMMGFSKLRRRSMGIVKIIYNPNLT